MNYIVCCTRGPMKGRRWDLTPQGVKIGRADSCEIRVSDVAAELYHCVVKLVDGKPTVQNLASNSGADVNGTNVDEAELDPMDRIRIGGEWFIVIASGREKGGPIAGKIIPLAILLVIAAVGAYCYRQYNGRAEHDRAAQPVPAVSAVKPSDDPVTTNRVVRIVNEEIVKTNRVVRIVDNIVVTNYVVETRRVDAKTGAVTVEGGENVYEPPPPSDGLVLSEDGKTLVSVPKDLKHVVIPDGVTSIGYKAFKACRALVRIEIPPSMAKMAEFSFQYCDNLKEVHITDLAAWCQMSVPECDPLLNHAGNLYLNGALVKDIKVPNVVTRIGGYVFYGCSSLTSVTIPRSVEHIGPGAFAKCSNLVEFKVDNGNQHYKVQNGLLLTRDGRELVAVPGGIGKVMIPNGVKTIGYMAGLGCSRLVEVKVPDGVALIMGHAFEGCSELSVVNIPDGVRRIDGWGAFCSCPKLATITIPGSVEKIGWGVFSGSGLTNVIIQSGVKIIDASAFNGTKLKTVAIPNSMTKIADAFIGCKSLESVTIPEGLTNIHERAFDGCDKLRDANGNLRLTRVPRGARRK